MQKALIRQVYRETHEKQRRSFRHDFLTPVRKSGIGYNINNQGA
jgi:hypothetical protein